MPRHSIACGCGCGDLATPGRRFIIGHRTFKRQPLVERFWLKVDQNGPIPEHRPDLGPCWLWLGLLNPGTGYGRLHRSNTEAPRVLNAHAYSYILARGPVPKGCELDHLCRVRACVNPDHLDPVTHLENFLRGNHPMAILCRSGVCKRGHERNAANTYWRKGTNKVVYCRPCRREARAAAHQREAISGASCQAS